MTETKFEITKSSHRILKRVLTKLRLSTLLAIVAVVGLSGVATAQSDLADEFRRQADREDAIVAELEVTTRELQQIQADLEDARRLVNKSELTIEETEEQKALIDAQIDQLALELENAAIEGYVLSDQETNNSLDATSATDRVRAETLLSGVQRTRAELIAELESLTEQRELVDFSLERAREIRLENIAVQEEKETQLIAQQEVQQELYLQVQTRLDDLQAEAIASEQLDDELRALIEERQGFALSVDGELSNPLSSTRITSSFGYRVHPIYGSQRLHAGIDLCPASGSCSGAPITAAGQGRVIFSGVQSGYGNTVIIDHGEGITTLYAHLSSIQVSEGQDILGLEQIGLVGASGNVTGAHLHFEVRNNGNPENPQNYIDF